LETRILKPENEETVTQAVGEAVLALKRGDVISFPTETVYALAGAARSPDMEDRLFELKQRPKHKPFSFMVCSSGMIEDLVGSVSTLGKRVISRCLPGPLTIVFGTDDGGIGVRMPSEDMALRIIDGVGGPLLSTSANISGEPAAASGKEVIRQLGGRIALIIDGGETLYKEASTVVEIRGSKWKILRQGVLGESAFRRCANKIVLFVCTGNTCRSPLAEALCKKLLAERVGVSPEKLEENGYTIISAAISGADAMPASGNAVMVGREFGVDLENHLSQRLTKEIVDNVDKIYVTEKSQIRHLKELSDKSDEKIEPLVPGGEDIVDPAGGTLDDYRICVSKIEMALKERIEEL